MGSQKNTSPLTEKQVLNNAKYIQKNRNRLGLVKAVEEALKLGAKLERVQRSLLNERIHGVDLVRVVKELPTANETTNS